MTGPGQTVLSVDLSCSCSQTHSRNTKASSSHMMINVVAKQTRGTILKPHQHLSTNVVVSSPHHILGAEAKAHTGSKSGNRLSSSVANRRGHTAWYITATTPAHNMLPQSPHFCQSSHPFDMHTALMFLPRVKHLTSRGLQLDIQSPCNARLSFLHKLRYRSLSGPSTSAKWKARGSKTVSSHLSGPRTELSAKQSQQRRTRAKDLSEQSKDEVI